jgi:hypothetical protein
VPFHDGVGPLGHVTLIWSGPRMVAYFLHLVYTTSPQYQIYEGQMVKPSPTNSSSESGCFISTYSSDVPCSCAVCSSTTLSLSCCVEDLYDLEARRRVCAFREQCDCGCCEGGSFSPRQSVNSFPKSLSNTVSYRASGNPHSIVDY